MVILDACVLIAYVNPTDAHHALALDILAEPERFVVNELTLAEFLVKPAMLGLDVEEVAAELLHDLGATRADPAQLPAQCPWDARVADVRAATGLRIPDPVVLASALSLHGQVASFDGRLGDEATKRKIRFAPHHN